VVGFEVPPVVAISKHRIFVQEIAQRQVGRVSAVAAYDHETRFGPKPHKLHQVADSHAFPAVVQARPGCNAVEIGHHLAARQRMKLLVSPAHRLLDQTCDAKIPRARVKLRRWSVSQNRKLVGQNLTGRHSRREIF